MAYTLNIQNTCYNGSALLVIFTTGENVLSPVVTYKYYLGCVRNNNLVYAVSRGGTTHAREPIHVLQEPSTFFNFDTVLKIN